MLSPEEQEAINTELAHYENRQAGCIDALKVLQRRRGWISDETVRELAAFLDMSATELDAIATFYNLIFRRPVGRHIILVCNSVTCWVSNYEGVLKQLSETLGIGLGQTTSDGRFTLLPIACLGACDHAPTLMVDGDLYHDVTADDIRSFAARYP
jgi:NADH-quinone oxidoreductase subunit E